jgi:hypothetical protein
MCSRLELYTYRDLARLWRVHPKTVSAWRKAAGARVVYRRMGTGTRRLAYMDGVEALRTLYHAMPGLDPSLPSVVQPTGHAANAAAHSPGAGECATLQPSPP